MSEGVRKKAKYPKYSQIYKSEWEQCSNLKGWIMRSEKGVTFAYCKFCDIDINFAYRGKTGLEKHAESQKHLNYAKEFVGQGTRTPSGHRTAVMAKRKNVRIKKEKKRSISSVKESMYLQDPLANNKPYVDKKEEPALNFDTGGPENQGQDQLPIDNPCDDIKEEPELNLDACGLEHNADTNLQQFEVDQLEDEQDAGAATLPLQQQQHPPSMLLLRSSPPHRMLTPPGKDTLSLCSPGQQCAGTHHEVLGRPRMEPELLALQHPATPPDTPPVRLSPTHLMSTAAMAAASALLEDVGLSAVQYPAQEAQNPQSVCTADNTVEPVGAPMLAAASGGTESISSNVSSCRNSLLADASHHNLLPQYCEEEMPVQPPDAGPFSHMAHRLHRQQHHSAPASTRRVTSTASSSKDIINDDVLVSLPVIELNTKLSDFPKEVVVRLKEKRRALKNRGYAQKRRSKWLQRRRELEMTNRTLVAELKHVKAEIVRISKQRDVYKQYLEQELCATIHTHPSDTASSSTTKAPDASLH